MQPLGTQVCVLEGASAVTEAVVKFIVVEEAMSMPEFDDAAEDVAEARVIVPLAILPIAGTVAARREAL